MDGAQDSLSMIRQLLDQRGNRPRRLAVEARGRLIQEQEEVWFGCQLDADSQPFPLLSIQACEIALVSLIGPGGSGSILLTFAGNTDHGFRISLHAQ